MDNSITKVLTRINEIKKRFGLTGQGNLTGNISGNGSSSFNETLKSNTENKAPEAEPQVTVNKKISASDIKEIAGKYARVNNIPASLVNAVIQTESGFRADAVSQKGAMGLMQLMPTTVKELGISNPFDVHENIMGGTSFLKKLLEKYDWDYTRALAAYNAGEAAVDENEGVPPYRETRQYVKKVIDAYLKNMK